VPEALRRLVQPVVEQSFDLVAPVYLRGRFEALLQSGVVAPAVRALYGKRIRFPIGSDFGISSRLVERQLRMPVEGRGGTPLWLASEGGMRGFFRSARPSSVFRSSPKGHAGGKRGRGSGARSAVSGHRPERHVLAEGARLAVGPHVRTGGTAADEPGTVDVSRIIETFQLGYRNLRDVWSAVLPPATLLELKRLTGLTPTSFRLPDDLWARIVYDFALAHRLRIMNRDHLLRAMTPVYLAWVASYTIEVGTAAPAAIEYRLERWEPHSNHRNRTSCPAGGGRIAFNP